MVADRQSGLLQFSQPIRGAVLRPRVVSFHIGNREIKRLGISRRGPDDSRGLQTRLVRDIVNRRSFDDLIFVEQGIGDQWNEFAGLAIEIMIANDSVFRGDDTGHERGVVWPGNSWEGAA